jgi:riboflavin kinase/FMN adenylyltransferase
MSIHFRGAAKKGKGIGKTLGFPTINLVYTGAENGIFVAEALVDKKWKPAAVHIGNRLSLDEEFSCEVFVIDWSGEILPGEIIDVRLFDKIRDVKKFSNLEKLKEQISKDVEFTRNWYNHR